MEKYHVELTKDNIISRSKTFDKHYVIVNNMLSQSGFGWDDKNMIYVEDDVWNNYAKANKDAASYRYKVIKYWDMISTLYNRDRATGEGARTANESAAEMAELLNRMTKIIQKREKELHEAEELLAKIGRNHENWTTPEPTLTPILKKRGMIKLNDGDMREAKKSLKEKGIKSEDEEESPIDDICEIILASMIEYMKDIVTNKRKIPNEEIYTMLANYSFNGKVPKKLGDPGTTRKIEDNPRELLELYRGITNDDCRTIQQRGKIRNIQLPAIKYFAYYIGTSILGRENTSNISSYHLGFLIAALTGETPYHLGALVARRLSNKGPIFGGVIASRILAYLDLPLDPTDVKITPMRLDIAAMKSHQFLTADSSLDNIVYRILFADGEERETLPQTDLFSIDRKPWSRSKEEVDEQLKIQGFHQQHDSEDAEPSYDYTVTYPGASSSTYPEYDPSSYYEGATSWAP
ncbi:hypothetical protein QYE76_037736 [Lolium multiflorum]|uniref:Myb/SANT-like domain-containing protein n=1 Tax=Lolium multiflorum TaxID=4521 RepID=A0AAD8UXU1_LOLMU|nr:hypothetical protein QYE76_037736 [Lolium multiflorum]